MIVGSGVVGAYLGKQIGDMEIWERSADLREKACSGLVSKNFRDLDVDIDDLVVNELKGASFHANGESFEVKKRQTQAYALDRIGLQKRLIEDAQENGCKVLYNKSWNGQEDEYIIGADGSYSGVARSMGIKRDYVFTYQVKAELEQKIDPEVCELHFGDFAPGFFAWMIPYGEKTAEIGLGYKNGNGKELYQKFAKNFKIKRVIAEQSAPIPVFNPKDPTVLGNKALVGDAAAQVKATTGGGIVFGMRCADILADSIKKGDLQSYENNWRKLYEKDLKAHLMVKKYSDKASLDKIFKTIREKQINRLIEDYGDMEHLGTLIKQCLKRPDLWPYFGKMFFHAIA